MNRIAKILLAVVCITAGGRVAYAADNGTEFGIEDDLTVLGTGGLSVDDPDVAIKGFSVFGATQAASSLTIPLLPGGIFVNGYVQISSGMYVTGGSTFSTGAYFTGVSSFSNVANIHIAGGAADQVLKKVAGGGMAWADVSALATGDDLGNHTAIENLIMTGFNVVGARYVTASSAALSGQLIVYGTSTLAGNTGITGTLGVSGAATLSNNLTVTGVTALNGAITLGDAAADLLTMNAQASFIGGSTFTAAGGGAYFQGISSFSNVSNIHIAGGTANQVLKKVAGGGMAWEDVSALVTGDNLGNHTATQNLVMTGYNISDARYITASSAALSGQLIVYSSSTLAGNTGITGTLGVSGAAALGGTLTVADNVQLGSSTSDIHAINKTVEAGVALAVDSGGASGEYAAKFYSGGSLSAWIKKK